MYDEADNGFLPLLSKHALKTMRNYFSLPHCRDTRDNNALREGS